MRILRWFLALLIVAYSVMNIIPIVSTLGYRMEWWATPTDIVRLEPLMAATPWWQLALWVVVVGLLWLAAWRLIKGGRAFLPFVAAVVLSFLMWLYMKMGPVYDTVWTKAELQADYVILAVEVIVAGLIWWLENKHRSPATSAA
jgi:hypothetical protein